MSFLINPYAFGVAAPLLLDSVSNVAAAFALFKLKTSYSGSCIRVRRSSDDAELDIGFSSGVLDAGAISSHCGAGSGFVKTWYDQSGNAKNYSHATAGNQPKIYESGSLLVDGNGKPRIKFDGSNDLLACTDTAFEINQPLTSIHVAESLSGNKIPFGSSSFGSFFAQGGGTTSFNFYAGNLNPSLSMNPQDPHILSFVWDDTSSIVKLNGDADASKSLGASGTNGTGVNQTIGAGGGSPTTYCWDGYIQLVIFISDAKAGGDLTVLHTGINDVLSIY